MTKTPSTDRSHIAHIPQSYSGVALVNRCQGMFLNEIHWNYDDALEAWRKHTATNGSGDDPDEQIVTVEIVIKDEAFRDARAQRSGLRGRALRRGDVHPCGSREEWIAAVAVFLAKHGHEPIDCGRYAVELVNEFEADHAAFLSDEYVWSPAAADEFAYVALLEARRS